MPGSPKVFFASSASRRSGSLRRLLSTPVFSAACLLFGLAGFVAAALALSRSPSVTHSRCPDSSRPLSVSVAWDRSPGDGSAGGSAELPASLATGSRGRHKVMAFVGIFTGFGSIGRRRALRRTWLPADRQGLLRLEEATGLAFRFVIGKSNSKNKMAALNREVEEYDDFVLLDLEEEYSRLPYKTFL
uniref:Hexosyltransferase n=1 Tax=Zea mays TaxID=4577 RepID=A0A804R3X1_MAIZE